MSEPFNFQKSGPIAKENARGKKFCSWPECPKHVGKKGNYCAWHKRKMKEKGGKP